MWLLEINSFCFGMSEKVIIYPLPSTGIFTRYRVPVWQLSPLSVLKCVPLIFWLPIRSLTHFYFNVTRFFLDALHFVLISDFKQFDYLCLGVVFFMLLIIGVHWVPLMSRFIIFTESGDALGNVSPNILSASYPHRTPLPLSGVSMTRTKAISRCPTAHRCSVGGFLFLFLSSSLHISLESFLLMLPSYSSASNMLLGLCGIFSHLEICFGSLFRLRDLC